MAPSFEEHYERARTALDDRERGVAREACEAALAVATEPYQKALALDGLAETHFHEDNHARALALLDQAIGLCLPHDSPQDVNVSYALARSWYDKAMFLSMLRRNDEALIVLDELIGRLPDRTTDTPRSKRELEFSALVARALLAKATILTPRPEVDESRIDCYEEVIARFGKATEPRLQRPVARAMLWRAATLGDTGRQDKEVEGYDDLVARFGGSDNEDILETVLLAFDRKTRLYQDQEDHGTVIETCDELIRRYASHAFGASPTPSPAP